MPPADLLLSSPASHSPPHSLGSPDLRRLLAAPAAGPKVARPSVTPPGFPRVACVRVRVLESTIAGQQVLCGLPSLQRSRYQDAKIHARQSAVRVDVPLQLYHRPERQARLVRHASRVPQRDPHLLEALRPRASKPSRPLSPDVEENCKIGELGSLNGGMKRRGVVLAGNDADRYYRGAQYRQGGSLTERTPSWVSERERPNTSRALLRQLRLRTLASKLRSSGGRDEQAATAKRRRDGSRALITTGGRASADHNRRPSADDHNRRPSADDHNRRPSADHNRRPPLWRATAHHVGSLHVCRLFEETFPCQMCAQEPIKGCRIQIPTSSRPPTCRVGGMHKE
eukprot:scaffold48_cov311-Pinguiococcus_pyrenoidosus.AAC.6